MPIISHQFNSIQPGIFMDVVVSAPGSNVMNINTGNVITARRAHGKEIKLYEEKFGK